MPTLTRWFVKSALLFFVAALFAGLAMVARQVWDLPGFFGTLGPVYFHLFMVGWITQLIFGVVYWMFPKYTVEKPRGDDHLAWATFCLLNLGLLLRAFGEPLQALNPMKGWGWVLAISATLQWLAGMVFVANTWGRVKER